MDRMLEQILAGWVRAAIPGIAGVVGVTLSGEVTGAIVTVVVASVVGMWSTAQKKGWVKF